MNNLFSLPQLTNYLMARRGGQPECKSEPATVCLFVTDRCTLSCTWCPRQSKPGFLGHIKPDMDLEKAARIFGYFPRATHLSLSGFGEPLLAGDLFRMAAEFRKRPVRISLITNGTLLADRIDEVINAGLHRISISLNALDAGDYQRVCGGDENTLGQVMKGISMLAGKRKNKKPHLQITFVLTRHMLDRVPETIKFAEEAGVDRLELHNLIPHDGGHDFGGMLTADDREAAERLAEWQQREYKVCVGWPRLVQRGLEYPARVCRALWEWLGVDLEGNTAGCSRAMFAKKEYGNLFRDNKQVWNNSFRQKLRKAFLMREKFLLDCCKTCTEVQP